MKGSKLNAAYARRRDVAEMKIEKTKEVDKYFDKWNQITTRYTKHRLHIFSISMSVVSSIDMDTGRHRNIIKWRKKIFK